MPVADVGNEPAARQWVALNQAGFKLIMANGFFSAAVALASIYAILKLSSGV